MGGRTAIVTHNHAYERAAKRADVKFITIEDYRCFRDVGLQGLAIDGTERPRARDRNGARNALFADLLITTGLRLEEASSLLAMEIEEAICGSASGGKQVAFRLPAALTKGDKGRTIRIPASLLTRLRSYLEVERSLAIEKFKARGVAKRMLGALHCTFNAGTIAVATKTGRAPLRLDTVTPDANGTVGSSFTCEITVVNGLARYSAAIWAGKRSSPVFPFDPPRNSGNCSVILFTYT